MPEAVVCVAFDVTGAPGGSSGGFSVTAGGLGGQTQATLRVTPGETIQVTVGGVGGAKLKLRVPVVREVPTVVGAEGRTEVVVAAAAVAHPTSVKPAPDSRIA